MKLEMMEPIVKKFYEGLEQGKFYARKCKECGYIPRGEAWRYAIDGRTAFDGDKPINPHGGRCNFGHAHGASGIADIYEAVKQMRGEAGATQMAKRPDTTFVRGFGGSQNVRCQILRAVR